MKRRSYIKLADWSDYNSELCNNGGCYVYYTYIYSNGKGEFEVWHDSSSDFLEEELWDIVSKEEALRIIREHRQDENCSIEYRYFR